MVALNAGSAAVRLVLWIRIFSSIGVLNSLSAMRATLPDSPGPLVVESSALVPRTPPIANAATTNASQPNVAVFQWLADQRPMRAAMCLDLPRDDICVGAPCVSLGTDRSLAERRLAAHGATLR